MTIFLSIFLVVFLSLKNLSKIVKTRIVGAYHSWNWFILSMNYSSYIVPSQYIAKERLKPICNCKLFRDSKITYKLFRRILCKVE